MNIRTVLLLLGLGAAAQASADAPGVWVYQPDGGSYRVESRAYQYDPRSPYSQHRQYQQNLPPRFQGQLPQQYYERQRGFDHRRNWQHQHQRHPGFDRPQRWRNDSRVQHRRPGFRDGRMHQRRGSNNSFQYRSHSR